MILFLKQMIPHNIKTSEITTQMVVCSLPGGKEDQHQAGRTGRRNQSRK